jgi:hypothetical protein
MVSFSWFETPAFTNSMPKVLPDKRSRNAVTWLANVQRLYLDSSLELIRTIEQLRPIGSAPNRTRYVPTFLQELGCHREAETT